MSALKQIVCTILERMQNLGSPSAPLLIAVDGRCASGKTTLASLLARDCGAGIVPMDHFFLRPEQRTEQRFAEPGGNVDRERFLDEVLPSLRRGEAFSYRPFNCREGALGDPIRVERKSVYLIEGSYSCHPALRENWDLKIFLTLDPEEQLRRIRLRNGPSCLERFRNRWIPLEERYFSACETEVCCDLVFDTTKASVTF